MFVGGLHPRKGVGDLILAFKMFLSRHPNAQLYLVGEGPNLKDYTALVADLGIAHCVHFVGAVNDPRPLLSAADIFVLPSRADPAPLVLSEAREAGCAIVASNVDGIPELLDGGDAGILVRQATPMKFCAR